MIENIEFNIKWEYKFFINEIKFYKLKKYISFVDYKIKLRK